MQFGLRAAVLELQYDAKDRTFARSLTLIGEACSMGHIGNHADFTDVEQIACPVS